MSIPALLAVSHGTASPTGQTAVAALVAAVAAHPDAPVVHAAHVDVQQPDVPTALSELGGAPVVVVPLLLSAGFHVHVDLREAIAEYPSAVIAPALGPDPRLVDVLIQRLDPLAPSPTDTVVLAVAGSSDERANDDCRAVRAHLSARLGRRVEIGFLAAASPTLGETLAQVRADGSDPVISTYLLAPGFFHDRTVDIADGARTARPLLDADPPPSALVSLVLDRYRHSSALLPQRS